MKDGAHPRACAVEASLEILPADLACRQSLPCIYADMRVLLRIPMRARYVMEQGGSPWLDALRGKPLAEVRNTLLLLHGVGRKVADCVTLFSLDQPSVVPVDTHVWSIACRDMDPKLNDSKSLTPKVHDYVAELFATRYGEHAGWAHSLLFAAELPKYTKLLPEAMQLEMKQFANLEKAAKEEARNAAKARKAAKAACVKKEGGSSSSSSGSGSSSGSTGTSDGSGVESSSTPLKRERPEKIPAEGVLSPRLAGSPPKRIKVKAERLF